MSNPQETQEFIAGLLKAWKWMMGLLQKKILGVSFYCQPYWFLPEGSTYCFLEKGWVCWYLFHSKKTPFGTTRLPIPTLGCLNPGRSTWKRRKNGRINFHRKKTAEHRNLKEMKNHENWNRAKTKKTQNTSLFWNWNIIWTSSLHYRSCAAMAESGMSPKGNPREPNLRGCNL